MLKSHSIDGDVNTISFKQMVNNYKEQKKAGTKKASKEEYHIYPSRGSESRK